MVTEPIADINLREGMVNYVAGVQIQTPHYTFFYLVIRTGIFFVFTAFLPIALFYLCISAPLHPLFIGMVALNFVDSVRTLRDPSIFQCVPTELFLRFFSLFF